MRRLKIVTYNIHRCFGVDGRYNPSRVARVIADLAPDIVGLQEVDVSLRAPIETDQLQFIAERTRMHAVIGATLKRSLGHYGNAILSRYPLQQVREVGLTYRTREPRGMILATVGLGDRTLRVANTHLGLRFFERAFQFQEILRQLEKERDELVLMGD